MGRKIALALAFTSFCVAFSGGQQPAQQKQDGFSIPTVSQSDRLLFQRMAAATAMQDNACSQCAHAMEEGGKCGDQTKDCKNGSVKACYLAAACVCQCQLDAGGCGSDRDALRECVEKNKKNAHDME
jgi:hypothetical protein